MKNYIRELCNSLSQEPLFNAISGQDLESFIRLGISQDFKKGQVLFEKYTESERMYVLKKGLIKVCSFSEDGKEVLLNYIYPGEVLGEIGVLDGGPRTASAYCAEDTELIYITKIRFFNFLEKNPHLYKAIIKHLCHYLRKKTETIEDGIFTSRFQRLSKKLLFVRDKQNNDDKSIRISQEELANMLGLSRELVNKSLQELQQNNLILLKRNQIQIVNEQKLKLLVTGESI